MTTKDLSKGTDPMMESHENCANLTKTIKIPCKFASRKLRDTQAIEEMVVIYLLNQQCDMIINKPAKRAVLTQQFMKGFGTG